MSEGVNFPGNTAPIRPVSRLYGTHEGEDIYIVGTGPSLRVFPIDFLEDKVTIGLNMAWRLSPLTYGITIHPELNIPDFVDEPARPEITWITKHEKLDPLTPEQRAHAEANYYFFRTDGRKNTLTTGQSDAGRFPEWVEKPVGDFLYLYSSISTTAVNLAAHLGARNIFLVGCDNGSIMGNHHAKGQHTVFFRATPEERYHDYFVGLAEIRPVLARRAIRLLSLTPFLTIGPHEEDFAVLCRERGVPELSESVDMTDVYRPQRSAFDRGVYRVKSTLLRASGRLRSRPQ